MDSHATAAAAAGAGAPPALTHNTTIDNHNKQQDERISNTNIVNLSSQPEHLMHPSPSVVPLISPVEDKDSSQPMKGDNDEMITCPPIKHDTPASFTGEPHTALNAPLSVQRADPPVEAAAVKMEDTDADAITSTTPAMPVTSVPSRAVSAHNSDDDSDSGDDDDAGKLVSSTAPTDATSAGSTMLTDSLMLGQPGMSSTTNNPTTNIGRKDKSARVSCHQCKTTKDDGLLLFCTTKAEKGKRKRKCRKKYCDACLRRSYNMSISGLTQAEIASYCCPACNGSCSCAACQRKQLESMVRKEQASRSAAFGVAPPARSGVAAGNGGQHFLNYGHSAAAATYINSMAGGGVSSSIPTAATEVAATVAVPGVPVTSAPLTAQAMQAQLQAQMQAQMAAAARTHPNAPYFIAAQAAAQASAIQAHAAGAASTQPAASVTTHQQSTTNEIASAVTNQQQPRQQPHQATHLSNVVVNPALSHPLPPPALVDPSSVSTTSPQSAISPSTSSVGTSSASIVHGIAQLATSTPTVKEEVRSVKEEIHQTQSSAQSQLSSSSSSLVSSSQGTNASNTSMPPTTGMSSSNAGSPPPTTRRVSANSCSPLVVGVGSLSMNSNLSLSQQQSAAAVAAAHTQAEIEEKTRQLQDLLARRMSQDPNFLANLGPENPLAIIRNLVQVGGGAAASGGGGGGVGGGSNIHTHTSSRNGHTIPASARASTAMNTTPASSSSRRASLPTLASSSSSSSSADGIRLDDNDVTMHQQQADTWEEQHDGHTNMHRRRNSYNYDSNNSLIVNNNVNTNNNSRHLHSQYDAPSDPSIHASLSMPHKTRSISQQPHPPPPPPSQSRRSSISHDVPPPIPLKGARTLSGSTKMIRGSSHRSGGTTASQDYSNDRAGGGGGGNSSGSKIYKRKSTPPSPYQRLRGDEAIIERERRMSPSLGIYSDITVPPIGGMAHSAPSSTRSSPSLKPHQSRRQQQSTPDISTLHMHGSVTGVTNSYDDMDDDAPMCDGDDFRHPSNGMTNLHDQRPSIQTSRGVMTPNDPNYHLWIHRRQQQKQQQQQQQQQQQHHQQQQQRQQNQQQQPQHHLHHPPHLHQHPQPHHPHPPHHHHHPLSTNSSAMPPSSSSSSDDSTSLHSYHRRSPSYNQRLLQAHKLIMEQSKRAAQQQQFSPRQYVDFTSGMAHSNLVDSSLTVGASSSPLLPPPVDLPHRYSGVGVSNVGGVGYLDPSPTSTSHHFHSSTIGSSNLFSPIPTNDGTSPTQASLQAIHGGGGGSGVQQQTSNEDSPSNLFSGNGHGGNTSASIFGWNGVGTSVTSSSASSKVHSGSNVVADAPSTQLSIGVNPPLTVTSNFIMGSPEPVDYMNTQGCVVGFHLPTPTLPSSREVSSITNLSHMVDSSVSPSPPSVANGTSSFLFTPLPPQTPSIFMAHIDTNHNSSNMNVNSTNNGHSNLHHAAPTQFDWSQVTNGVGSAVKSSPVSGSSRFNLSLGGSPIGGFPMNGSPSSSSASSAAFSNNIATTSSSSSSAASFSSHIHGSNILGMLNGSPSMMMRHMSNTPMSPPCQDGIPMLPTA